MDPNNQSNNQYDVFGNLIDPNFQYESPVSQTCIPNSFWNSPDPYPMSNPYHYTQMLNEGSPSSNQDRRTTTGSNTPHDVPLFSTQRRRREDEATSPIKKKTSRGWTPKEDVLLVSAWLNTSKDSIQGNEQKSDGFWKKVKAYYDENRSSSMGDRGDNGVFKNRWYRLSKDVNKFGGCYARVVQRQESGQSQADILERAKELFREETSKAFTGIHAWKILRSEQKWMAEYGQDNRGSSSSKRTKNSAAGAYTSSSNTDNLEHLSLDLSDDDFIHRRHNERPIGRDGAKRKEKEKQRNIAATTTSFQPPAELDKYLTNIKDTEDKRFEAMAKIAEAHAERARTKKESIQAKMDIRQRELDQRQRELDQDVLYKDTSNMDPYQLEIHRMLLEQVKRRLANM